jgi:ABC-type transport system involved in multi-copper enzyme maturation permease subunit
MNDDAYDEAVAGSAVVRDGTYAPPSDLRQIYICYCNQMKLFSKQKWIYAMYLLVLAIPVLYPVLADAAPSLFKDTMAANVYASDLLAALPAVSMLLASVVCGTALPREYKENTIGFTIPIPVKRWVFFIGKFLAGFTIPVSIVCAAYAVSLVLSAAASPMVYTGEYLGSLAIAVAGIFFYCSFSFMLGACLGRGSSMVPFLLLLVVVPAVCILAVYAVPGLSAVLGYAPVFASDLSLDMLGGANTSASLVGMFSVLLEEAVGWFKVGPDPAVMCLSSIAFGIVCLAIGIRINDRRDA